jgi:MFS family permease
MFYGWRITATFAVMVFASAGIRHAVGPFLKPMVADLGVDRASFSLVIALGLFLYGAFMPVVGALVDRLGARLVTSAGCVVLAGSLVLTAFCRTIWELAVSVLGSAAMAGMSLMVPILAWLILTVGWRTTYIVIGGFVLACLLPLCVLVLRDSPESMGLGPDGVRAASAAPPKITRTPITTAATTVAFWQLSGSFFTCGFSMSLISSHGVPMLTDHGYTPLFASWTLGVLGGGSILFTLLLGPASDRFGRRPVLAAIYGGRALVFAALFSIRDNPTVILAVAFIGGLTLAGSMSMTSALTADIYGRFSVGTILGAIFLVHQTGAAIGSYAAGALFEATGGYGLMYAIACAVLVAAALVSLRIDAEGRQVSWVTRAARV